MRDDEYQPACVEACPTSAIIFGNLRDEAGQAAKATRLPGTFRLLERLGTEPKVYYHSQRQWVRDLAATEVPLSVKEGANG